MFLSRVPDVLKLLQLRPIYDRLKSLQDRVEALLDQIHL